MKDWNIRSYIIMACFLGMAFLAGIIMREAGITIDTPQDFLLRQAVITAIVLIGLWLANRRAAREKQAQSINRPK